MEYHVRTMEERDVPYVSKIENEIFSLPWSEKSFIDAACNPDNIYLVCERTGEIAGYCGMWTVMGEGNVTNVAVHPSYRRQGVAEALLKEMERRAKEKSVTIFFLEVRQSNEAAKKLYEKLGKILSVCFSFITYLRCVYVYLTRNSEILGIPNFNDGR